MWSCFNIYLSRPSDWLVFTPPWFLRTKNGHFSVICCLKRPLLHPFILSPLSLFSLSLCQVPCSSCSVSPWGIRLYSVASYTCFIFEMFSLYWLLAFLVPSVNSASLLHNSGQRSVVLLYSKLHQSLELQSVQYSSRLPIIIMNKMWHHYLWI